MGIFNNRRVLPITSRIQAAIMLACSKSISRISWEGFKDSVLDIDSDTALYAEPFMPDRFKGLPWFVPCLTALLRPSISAERVRLAVLLEDSAQEASKEGITNSGSGDLLLALAGLLGACLAGEISSSSFFGEYSGLSGSFPSPSTTH